ncbi:MAG TPA: RNA 2',3'-cyclic phosphodiesterase, partial [Roseiarcus sp.]|nr:RNA 2',3'-cyclic phosphodiesterase [Roseiarcus sp.]
AKLKPEPALMDLQAEHERRLRRIGVGQASVASYLAMRGAPFADPFEAERFVLYSARKGSGGGPYVVEAAYPLG